MYKHIAILKNTNNLTSKFSNLFFRTFSSKGHGNGSDSHDSHGSHGHGEPSAFDYHSRRVNRISYNKVLSETERKSDPSHRTTFQDDHSDFDVTFWKQKIGNWMPNVKYEVLIPYNKLREELEDKLLDRTEVQARIYNLLREFDFKALDDIDFDSDFEKELGLDSLEWTALVTSIEYEFHTVFEDNLYDHFRTINDFVRLIENDHQCF